MDRIDVYKYNEEDEVYEHHNGVIVKRTPNEISYISFNDVNYENITQINTSSRNSRFEKLCAFKCCLLLVLSIIIPLILVAIFAPNFFGANRSSNEHVKGMKIIFITTISELIIYLFILLSYGIYSNRRRVLSIN